MLQFILNNLWLLIPILIGLANVGVRIQQKAKEQQARRAAQAEIQRRKAEALRTGKAVDEPAIVYDQPQTRAQTQTQTQTQQSTKDDRQARIEALRKQRMEQLRAIREKRASIAGKAAPPQSMGRSTPSNPTRSPTQTRTPLPAQRPQPQRPSQGQPGQSIKGGQIRPRGIPGSGQQQPAPTLRASISPQQPIRPPPSNLDRPSRLKNLLPDHDSPLREATSQKAPAAAQPQRRPSASPTLSARKMLRSRKQVRQAIIVREILDVPNALRDPSRGPGSITP